MDPAAIVTLGQNKLAKAMLMRRPLKICLQSSRWPRA